MGLTKLKHLELIKCHLELNEDSFKSMTQLESFQNINYEECYQPKRKQDYKFTDNYLPSKLTSLKVNDFFEWDIQLVHENLNVLDIQVFYESFKFTPQLFPNLKHLKITKKICKAEIIDLDTLKELETLSLREHMIPMTTNWSNLVNLKYLDLSFCPNLRLTEHTFSGLVNLENLYLSSIGLTNNLQNLEIFSNLKRLKILDLSKNNLRKFEKEMFRNQLDLQELDLSGNLRLKRFPFSFILMKMEINKALPNLKILKLDEIGKELADAIVSSILFIAGLIFIILLALFLPKKDSSN